MIPKKKLCALNASCTVRTTLITGTCEHKFLGRMYSRKYRTYNMCGGHTIVRTIVIWHEIRGILFAAPVWCNYVSEI